MTLIELLVVLVIISLLTALTLPVFIHSRNMGHRGVCISNMRQVTLAMHLYQEDYDQYFPTFLADPRSASRPDDLNYWHDSFCRSTYLEIGQPSWATLVRPYTGRNTSQHTPLNSETARVFFCPQDRDNQTRAITSYEYKMWLAMVRSFAHVEYHATTIEIWEQWTYHSREMYNEHDRRARLNVAFVDGHVRSLLLAETTNAIFGTGPDLHFPFAGTGPDARYANQDVAR
jgi:prepilin-type processing-associated H-X9-DG protein